MKILICANKDVYANIFLNHFLKRNSHHDISVLFSTSIGGSKKRSIVLEYLRFFEQELFNDYLFPMCDADDHNDTGELKTFSRLSRIYDVDMQEISNINRPEGIQTVSDIAPDLILSVRFGQILKPPVIRIPKHGAVNIHSGLLPEYRGVLATFWSLLHGNGEFGYTVHRIMDSGIDTGDMIERKVLESKPDQSLFCHIREIYPLAADSLTQVVQTLEAGESLTASEQPKENTAYYTYPETIHFEQLTEKGFKLLNKEKYFELLNSYNPRSEAIGNLSLISSIAP